MATLGRSGDAALASRFAAALAAELRAVGASNVPVADLRIFKEKDGENADYTVVAQPGRAHDAVVEDFVTAVRGG